MPNTDSMAFAGVALPSTSICNWSLVSGRARERERQVHEPPGMAGGPPDRAHELLIGQDLRPAQLERAAERRLFGRQRERERDVLDPDGLRGEMAVAEHRYNGRPTM